MCRNPAASPDAADVTARWSFRRSVDPACRQIISGDGTCCCACSHSTYRYAGFAGERALDSEAHVFVPATDANSPELPCIPQAADTATTASPTLPSTHAIRNNDLRAPREVSSDNDCVSRLAACPAVQ